jgi:phosphatidate cytidylyltransferase
MKTRAITGFFFIIVMLGSVLLGHYPFGIFYLVLSLLCLHEFYGLNIKSGIEPNRVAGFINAVLIYGIFAFITYQDSPLLHKLLFLITLSISAIFIQELFKLSVAPFTNIAYTFAGLVLVCLPFTFFHALAYVRGVLLTSIFR